MLKLPWDGCSPDGFVFERQVYYLFDVYLHLVSFLSFPFFVHALVFDERSSGESALLRPLLPAMSPPESMASYEDDFASLQGSSTSADRKIAHDLR